MSNINVKIREQQNHFFIPPATKQANFTAMENTQDITLTQVQKTVDEWITTYGVRYFNELTNMVLLTEEVGEMARIIARRYGEQSEKDSDRDKDLGDEMADVLWVLVCLANQTGVDLTAALQRNIDKKTKRDHSRHHNNEKLSQQDTATD